MTSLALLEKHATQARVNVDVMELGATLPWRPGFRSAGHVFASFSFSFSFLFTLFVHSPPRLLGFFVVVS